MRNENDKLRRQIVDLLGFLLTSAHGLFDEPKSYGPLRLLDAAGRLLEVSADAGINDEFLNTISKAIHGIRFESALVDRQILDEIITMYARELRLRDNTE
jgi:hypothetical protein